MEILWTLRCLILFILIFHLCTYDRFLKRFRLVFPDEWLNQGKPTGAFSRLTNVKFSFPISSALFFLKVIFGKPAWINGDKNLKMLWSLNRFSYFLTIAIGIILIWKQMSLNQF